MILSILPSLLPSSHQYHHHLINTTIVITIIISSISPSLPPSSHQCHHHNHHHLINITITTATISPISPSLPPSSHQYHHHLINITIFTTKIASISSSPQKSTPPKLIIDYSPPPFSQLPTLDTQPKTTGRKNKNKNISYYINKNTTIFCSILRRRSITKSIFCTARQSSQTMTDMDFFDPSNDFAININYNCMSINNHCLRYQCMYHITWRYMNDKQYHPCILLY